MKIKRNLVSLARSLLLAVANLSLLCISFSLQAAQQAGQQVPDAGRLLREQPKAPPILPGTSPQPAISPDSAEQKPQDEGAKLLVKGFRIEGATKIPAAELESQIHAAVGKELSLKQLQGVAQLLTAYYAQKGFLAQALVPPQDVENGIVLIKIIEGKRGDISIQGNGKRVDNKRVQSFIDYRLPQGAPMSLEKLGEALNILNEQPGVDVKSTLKPGGGEGETNLLVTTNDKPLTTFNFGLNNKGSRGTGEVQALASATLNNPLGLFDMATALLNKSDGSTFGLLDYNLAVGSSGLRAGVNLSHLNYAVTQQSLRAFDAHGTATTYGLKAAYPIYRRAEYSLNLTSSLDAKYLHDFTITGETDDHRVKTLTIGVDGSRQDSFGGGGTSGFGVGLVYGNSHENNVAAIATDAASRKALGSFGKLKYSLDRQQLITKDWALVANLHGQFAFDNLDSTERFSLGGTDGVRAYPTGEAGADQGWVLSLNLVHPFSKSVQGSLFLDTGSALVNKNTWAGWNAGNPSLKNRYQLSGVGASVDWQITDKIGFSAILAAPLGNNPGRDTNGKDADGRKSDVRGWVNLVGQF